MFFLFTHRLYIEYAKLVVEKGADVNLNTPDLATPFIQALIGGKSDIAKWLIEIGADIIS